MTARTVGFTASSIPQYERSYLLDHCRDSLSDPDTHRRHPERDAAPTHLMRQRHDQPRPRASERMSQRDRAAVHVEDLLIDFQISVASKDLRAERLVDFEQVDIVDLEPGS